MPDAVVSRVMGMYDGIGTTFKSLQGDVPVNLKRGVKQGDPSSPLLFNLALDPLIKWIDAESHEGFGPLAYADDLVVLCRNPEEAQLRLQTVDSYLKAIGMELSVDKCSSFWLRRIPSGAMSLRCPELTIGDRHVRSLAANDRLTYLGVSFNPLTGLDNSGVLDRLVRSTGRISRLPMKPRQKLKLFFEFLIPRVFYRMAIDPPSKTRLKTLDATIRTWVKSVCHLPPSTPNGLIHCKTRDGGLGFPRLTYQVWLSHLKAARAVLDSNDTRIRDACRVNGVLERVRRAAGAIQIEWPDDGPDLFLAKEVLGRSIVEKWKSLESTGHGVQSFINDPIGNRWLSDPTILKESNFLIALRLRANLFGTRQALRRVDRGIPPDCRKCNSEVESLIHVLNVCPASHAKIVKRHDDIKEVVVNRLLENGHQVLVEQSFDEPGTRVRLRPDIVAIKDGDIKVVDIAVTYERGEALKEVTTGKIRKYSVLKDSLLERFAGRNFRVLPVVAGSRGALPEATKRNLRSLGLVVATDGLTVSSIALRCSIGIAARHLDNG